MMKKHRYSVIIQWSEEDQAYVVTLPEWGGCHTHGDTYEEAAKNAQEVLDLLIEGEPSGPMAPAPHGFMFPGPSGFTYDFSQPLPAPQPSRANEPIKSLMNDLASTSNRSTKKAIRARLRQAGHYGGSRTPAHEIAKADVRKFRRSST
jgi:predicted RNase H-like HicB family nuclease